MSSQESSNCSIGSPYATSRQCSSPCPTNGGKRFNPDGASLRFEPFMDSNLQIETPDIVGVGGGAWIPPLVPLLDASRPHSSPILDFHLPKRLIIAARDKESLLEEVISLKSELNYQSRKFMAHRIQANTIETENRKLEKDLEELELLKADARRTGGTERLRTKLNGMKCRLEDLHMVCEEQRDELFNLRKDVRLTRTRELEVERNVFAEEVIRLLKYMKRLKACQNKLNCENKELANVRDRATLLEIANKRLESCLTAINKNLEKTKQETALFKRKALETATSNKVDEKKRKELEDQAAKLAAQLDMETTEKQKWVRKASQLEHEIRKLSKELKEAMAAKNAKLDLLTVTVPAKKGTGSPPSSGKKGSVSDKPKSPERPKSPKKQVVIRYVGESRRGNQKKAGEGDKGSNGALKTATSDAGAKDEAARKGREEDEEKKRKAAALKQEELRKKQELEEEQRRKLEEEVRKRKEEELAKKKKKEEAAKKKAEEEARRKAAAEEKKAEEEEEARRRKAEEEEEARRRKAEEEEGRRKAEEDARRAEADAALRKKAADATGTSDTSSADAEEERRKRLLEEAEEARRREAEAKAEEEARRRETEAKAEEEARRREAEAKAEEEVRTDGDDKRGLEEELKRKQDEELKKEEEVKKRQQEEELKRKQEELKRKQQEAEERRRKLEEEEERRRKLQEDERRRKLEEDEKREAEEKRKQEDEQRRKREAEEKRKQEEKAKKEAEEHRERKAAAAQKEAAAVRSRSPSPEVPGKRNLRVKLSTSFAEDTKQVVEKGENMEGRTMTFQERRAQRASTIFTHQYSSPRGGADAFQ